MSLYRRNPKRDGNESEIVKALRRVGASVQPLSAKGCPDILCGFRGVNILLEIKDAKGEETDDQKQWAALWQGQRAVVRSVDEALAAIGVKI